MRVLKLCLILGAAVYLALGTIFFFTQRSLLYFPAHTSARLADTSHANRSFREVSFKTEDGLNLTAWYAPAAGPHVTLVLFHGNADSLSSVAPVADPYIAAGCGFLIVEFRGYSGLQGHPTESGLYEDGRSALHFLHSQSIETHQIVLFAHSLGTGVATEIAREFPVAGVILLAPYTSIPDVAQPIFPMFPVHLLALDRFNSAERIAAIHSPLLILNGADDQVIPPVQGLHLYELAHEPRQFKSLPKVGHNDIFEPALPIVLHWLEQLPRGNR